MSLARHLDAAPVHHQCVHRQPCRVLRFELPLRPNRRLSPPWCRCAHQASGQSIRLKRPPCCLSDVPAEKMD